MPVSCFISSPAMVPRIAISSGETNFDQSCVPTGTHRRICSAPTMAIRYDFSERFKVDMITMPPGLVRLASVATNASTLFTCSITSNEQTTSNNPGPCTGEPSPPSSGPSDFSERRLGDPEVVDASFSLTRDSAVALLYIIRSLIAGSLSLCLLATSTECSTASRPSTQAPNLANGSLSIPPPHPTSKTRTPARGSRVFGFSPK
mmetsp:Transcript_37080/g.51461  ORF Transcript_37080/g.51461 Transcript_37080/m.51461 type:complete len:204 (+) Transcript_37080:291-902(+)